MTARKRPRSSAAEHPVSNREVATSTVAVGSLVHDDERVSGWLDLLIRLALYVTASLVIEVLLAAWYRDLGEAD